MSAWAHCAARDAPFRHVGVGDLRERVHAGIGAARAMHPQRRAEHAGKGALEVVLHAFAIRLALPAAEGPAVVGDHQLQPLGGHWGGPLIAWASSHPCRIICAAT